MKPKPSPIDELMNAMFAQAKARFGPVVKSNWVYADDLCPGCQQNPIGEIKFKGKTALAINSFIYRARGVLIGYFLCETCANYIHAEAAKNPYKQTPLHAEIERTLSMAYDEYRTTLN